jgi:hypothetical protein
LTVAFGGAREKGCPKDMVIVNRCLSDRRNGTFICESSQSERVTVRSTRGGWNPGIHTEPILQPLRESPTVPLRKLMRLLGLRKVAKKVNRMHGAQ